MVEGTMAESDITAMKETLRAQQQLLQKLYAELDQEREASASAASEAMDMILRLQGEKAAVKMEASHYKRMAEEKIGHAEATLEVFEELMYQKEMEITSLEFQISAYRNKLLTLGSDFNAGDLVEFTEDLLLSTSASNDQVESDLASSSAIRRLTSLPPYPVKNNIRSTRKRERSPSPVPVPDMFPRIVESDAQAVTSPSLDLPRKSEDYAEASLDAYWNQIKRLDEKVKEISDCKESGGEQLPTLRSRRGRSCSIFSQTSHKLTFDQTDRVALTSCSDKENQTQDKEEAVDIPSCSANVHDVFEVPQTREQGNRKLEKWISDADDRLTKPDLVSEEIIEPHVTHDMNKLKSMLGGNLDSKISSPKDMKTIFWQRKEGLEDCNTLAEFQKLHRRIDQLERETISARKEIMKEMNGEEHLRLLKDIYTELKLMQSEMRRGSTPKPPPKRDTHVDPLQEAMVYFWL
ncbi:unnamed protein product [Sphenostylis stenocarpa]|uniref:GTD-binding domain-containing protein n=1 Tax=Sphenostylis stenocarpa TaxID=92480 RepID=A0AA86SEM3_9FABA|nr:unnamed protein product [Sphenostylis stenocarpa]